MNAPARRPEIAPGFTDPVHEAQAVFRAVLDAMAEPGREVAVSGITTAPSPLSPVAAAVIATLSDFETTIWRDETLRTPAIDAWLAFHTGSPTVAEGRHADFALLADGATAPAWESFSIGTDLDPSRSTTVIIRVDGFGAGLAYRLAGPGIATTRDVALLGAPVDLAARATANNALYPRGVDLILAGPTSLMALPRTTRIEEVA